MSSLPPTVKKFASFAWAAVFFFAVFWMMFWKDIRNSDTYQRSFNTEQWEKKQQVRAERIARHKELDQMECYIKLRAEAALVPIEIERSTLYGMSQDNAEAHAMKEFELDKKLCEEHDISPSAATSKGDARDDCERHPGVYGC